MKRVLFVTACILLPAGFALAQQTFYFPQIADGMQSGDNTHWHTTIFLSNQSASTAATGTVRLFLSSGSPMNISFVDEVGNAAAVGNQISFSIPPGQTKKYTSTSASGNLVVGHAIVTSNSPIAGNAMFAHWTNPPGEALMSEAGVPAAGLMTRQAVFADTQFGYNTGVAISNPGSSAASLTFELVDADGHLISSTTQTLGPGQHVARFVTELFGNVPAMTGRMQITSSAGVAAMALRFDSRLENFTTLFPFSVQDSSNFGFPISLHPLQRKARPIVGRFPAAFLEHGNLRFA